MKAWFQKSSVKRDCLSIMILSLSVSFILFWFSSAYAFELYSKDDSPFGPPYNDWIGKWWSWYIKTNASGNEPVSNGCIINKAESMIMLMDTTVNGNPHQKCGMFINAGYYCSIVDRVLGMLTAQSTTI